MQIVGIDYSETGIRCGRIQNPEKPEFIKLKQFAANKKGMKSLDEWLDECCLKDRASLMLSLIVEDQEGASIAWRYHNLGYAIIPMTYYGIRQELLHNPEKRTPAELIARKAVTWKQRWTPFTQRLLELRSALLEREIARIGCMQNQARNQAYEEEAFDFLIQLTRNATNIHANRMMEAENTIRSIIDKTADFKETFDLLMTIPGMNDMAAAALMFVMKAYPSQNGEQFCRMLKLHDGSAISRSNYRAPELRIVRNELYELAQSTALDLPAISDYLDRLSTKDKSEKTIFIAISHKYAKMAYAIASQKKAYRNS